MYNERLKDLLVIDPAETMDLKINRLDPAERHKTTIKNLRSVAVVNSHEARDLLRSSLTNRITSSTQLNSSSRNNKNLHTISLLRPSSGWTSEEERSVWNSAAGGHSDKHFVNSTWSKFQNIVGKSSTKTKRTCSLPGFENNTAAAIAVKSLSSDGNGCKYMAGWKVHYTNLDA